jgi:serine protease Do
MPRLSTAALALLFAVAPARAQDDRPARERVRDVERVLRQVIDDAEASVVAVSVSRSPRYAGGLDPANPGKLGDYITPQAGGGAAVDASLDLSDLANVGDHPFGSGVVLDVDGLILTTYHLIDGARKIYVRGPGGRGSYADIYAADARSDLAVLKLLGPIEGLKSVKIADGRVDTGPNGEKPTIARGMWCVALSHADAAGFADGVPGASWGIVSAVRRRVLEHVNDPGGKKPLSQLSSLIQTDARIALGSSGGALLNMDGELIGLCTPTAALTGAETAGGFAVPMDQNYRRIVATLKEGREVEYGFLGVTFRPSAAGARLLDGGLPIGDVAAGSPAARAGLAGFNRLNGFDVVPRGDTIVAVDGRPLREMDDLHYQLGAALAGSTVKLTVVRGGQRRNVDVTLAKNVNELPVIASVRPAPVFGMRVDWGSTSQVRANGLADQPAGVVVREIAPDSPAATKLKQYDPALRGTWFVTAVDGRVPETPARFAALTRGKESVTLRMVNLADPRNPVSVTFP